MARYGIIIDVNKCNGCYNCFLSCRDEYAGNDYPPYSGAQPVKGQYWMRIREKERGTYPKVKVSYIPTPCMHCETAPCMEAAKDNAVFRRDDGIVLIDPEKAKGQDAIVVACPYRVIYWNADKQIPQKCTMCAHRLDEGEKMPRCVESCPTGALIFGDFDDPASEIAKGVAEFDTEYLHPEFNTRPLVKYVGLPQCFIAGEVILKDQQGECAQDVAVLLEGDGRTVEIASDTFGDFEFKGLKADTRYRVIIRKTGYVEREIEVTLKQDVNLGEVLLDPTV